MKNLPVSTDTFKDIIELNYLYIDKTEWIYNLLETPKGFYFLSRPRRFGKSLTISTLKEIFEGNKDLFKGLFIYNTNYQWNKYPIIRINFSEKTAETTNELKEFIISELDLCAKQYGVELSEKNYSSRFKELIIKLNKINKVVILIDEYDYPIIDNLEKTDFAISLRKILKGFYTIIKASDEYLRFALLTGVSKFSRAGIFSGLNNLTDLSMDPRYSAMLGITEDELNTYFNEYIKEFAEIEKNKEQELVDKIREWYNGFCFSGNCKKVYNPYSIMLLFNNKRFSNYWFKSGTPTFLIKLLKIKDYNLESIEIQKVKESAFSSYEIENLELTALLLQTGYLTIKQYDKEYDEYTLGFPNKEIRISFFEKLLEEYSGKEQVINIDLIKALKDHNLKQFFKILQTFFAGIPHNIQITKEEKYYQSIFYSILMVMGLNVKVEVSTNIGRIDAVIEDYQNIFIFEFKLNGTEKEAIKQIKDRKYYEKYLITNKLIYLIGVEFKNRNISKWVYEIMPTEQSSFIQEKPINSEIKIAINLFISSFDDLKTKILKANPDLEKEITKLDKTINDLATQETEKEVIKTIALSNIKKFIDDLRDDKSNLGKTLKNINKGDEILSDLVDGYNKIIDFIGIEQFSKISLKNKK